MTRLTANRISVLAFALVEPFFSSGLFSIHGFIFSRVRSQDGKCMRVWDGAAKYMGHYRQISPGNTPSHQGKVELLRLLFHIADINKSFGTQIETIINKSRYPQC
jgi:hypothetical protein